MNKLMRVRILLTVFTMFALGGAVAYATVNSAPVAQLGSGIGWLTINNDVRLLGQVVAVNSITATNDLIASDDVIPADDLTVGDDGTIADDFSVTDDTTLGGDLTVSKQTRVVVSNGSTVTPLGSYQPISSTANTGTSSITAGDSGDVLYLINMANTTITFTDTGTLKLSGNVALSQYDTLLLWSDGTNWYQLATGNN